MLIAIYRLLPFFSECTHALSFFPSGFQKTPCVFLLEKRECIISWLSKERKKSATKTVAETRDSAGRPYSDSNAKIFAKLSLSKTGLYRFWRAARALNSILATQTDSAGLFVLFCGLSCFFVKHVVFSVWLLMVCRFSGQTRSKHTQNQIKCNRLKIKISVFSKR